MAHDIYVPFFSRSNGAVGHEEIRLEGVEGTTHLFLCLYLASLTSQVVLSVNV